MNNGSAFGCATVMFRRFAFCMIASCVANEAIASEWYASAKLSGGFATVDDITDKGSIGSGLPVGGIIDGEIEESEFDDKVLGIGFSVGRIFNDWALEAELIWRYRSDWDLTIPTPEIQTITNIFTNIETTTVLVNAIRRGAIDEHWSWEFGAGIGMALSTLESDYKEREIPGVMPESIFEDTSKNNEFAWNVLLGVTWEFTGPWRLNGRYRYVDFGDLEAGPYPSRNSRVFGQWSSHEFLLSVERDL